MIKNSSTTSVYTVTSSESEGAEIGIFSQVWNNQTELLYNLCGRLPRYKTIATIAFILENLHFMILSIDRNFAWGVGTKKVLSWISWIRGPVPDGWNYSIAVPIMLGMAFMGSLLPLILSWNAFSSANNSPIFSTLYICIVILYKVLYFPIMSILLIPSKCDISKNVLVDFPDIQCWTVPNVILYSLKFFPMGIMVVGKSVMLICLLDKFHKNSPFATADGRFLCVAHIFQTVILFVTEAIHVDGYRIIAPILGLVLTLLLLCIHIRFMTFYRFWINLIYGSTLAFSCGGFIACIVAEVVRDKEFSIIVLVSSIPLVIVFICIACIRNWIVKSYILAQLDISGSSVIDAFKWFKPLDFDVAARSIPDTELRLKVYEIGFEKHKTSLRMRVLFAMYLLESQEQRHFLRILLQPHNSKSLLELDARFFYLYCKSKKREMEVTQNNADKGIIKELARAKKCFGKIRILLKQVWEICMNEQVNYSRLMSIISTIDSLENKYETIINGIFKINPNHVGALRAYGVFEAEIRRNLYHAETLFNEADIAEDKRGRRPHYRPRKFAHYMKQAVSLIMRQTSVSPNLHDLNYIVEKEEQTTKPSTVELDDITKSQAPDPDQQSTSSHESQTFTHIKPSTGLNLNEIAQMDKLRTTIDQSSVRSTIILRLALFISVILGICLIAGGFIKSYQMLKRFDIASETINIAVDARTATLRSILGLRGLPIVFTPLVNQTRYPLKPFSHYIQLAITNCNQLRDICNELYSRASSQEESKIWRESNIPIQIFFEDGTSVVQNYSLRDSCTTYTSTCFKIVNLPESTFREGNIIENVDYKFLLINGNSVFIEGLRNMVGVLQNVEKDYRNRFIAISIVIPILSLVLFVIVIPVCVWVWINLSNAFKMLLLVKKDIIANTLRTLENQKNQAEEELEGKVYFKTPTIVRFTINFLIVTIILGLLLSVFSLLGGLVALRFEKQIYEVDAACLIQQTVHSIREYTSELLFTGYTYFDEETLIRMVRRELETLKKYDEALRSGNEALGLSATDTRPEFYDLYYKQSCDNVSDVNCNSLNQLMLQFIQETERVINNYSIDSVHFANLANLADNVLPPKLNLQINMFKRGSDSTIIPVRVVNIIWIIVAIISYCAIFFYMFQNTGRVLEREILRAKKLFLYLPLDALKTDLAIMNYLNNKKVNVRNTLHEAHLIREGLYSRILQTTVDAVVEFSSNRRIIYVNPEAETMFQCEAKMLVGLLFDKLFTSDSTDELLIWISKNIKKKKAFQSEMTAITQSKSSEQSTFPVRVIIAFSESTFTSKLLGKSTTYVAFIRNIIAEKKQHELLMEERKKSQELICNILPKSIASQKMGSEDKVIVSSHSEVTMLFADISGFTSISSKMPPEELISMLNDLFSAFDELAIHYKLEKIKTIGDCYFVAASVPEYKIDHAEAMLEFAIDMLDIVQLYNKKTGYNLQIRIGINTGPVVAGVIGKQKYCYDLWGDAVNVASRMESTGIPGKIQVSRETYKYLYSKYNFKERELSNVKGKGQMVAYVYEGRKIPRKENVVNISNLINYMDQNVTVEKANDEGNEKKDGSLQNALPSSEEIDTI